jgi:hypothetical protein
MRTELCVDGALYCIPSSELLLCIPRTVFPACSWSCQGQSVRPSLCLLSTPVLSPRLFCYFTPTFPSPLLPLCFLVSPALPCGWALPRSWSWSFRWCLRLRDYSWSSSSYSSRDRYCTIPLTDDVQFQINNLGPTIMVLALVYVWRKKCNMAKSTHTLSSISDSKVEI